MKRITRAIPAIGVVLIAAVAVAATGTIKSCSNMPESVSQSAPPARFGVSVKNNITLGHSRWELYFPNHRFEFVDTCPGGLVTFAPEVAEHNCTAGADYTFGGLGMNDLTVTILGCSPRLPVADYRNLFSPCFEPVGTGDDSLVGECVATTSDPGIDDIDCSFDTKETTVTL